MTKCIKGNLAAMALLAGVEEPSGINNIVYKDNSRTLNVLYFNNTIHVTEPSNKLVGVIEIFNLKGRLIYRNVINENNRSSIKINSTIFAGGVYHIRLISGERAASAKFAITR